MPEIKWVAAVLKVCVSWAEVNVNKLFSEKFPFNEMMVIKKSNTLTIWSD